MEGFITEPTIEGKNISPASKLKKFEDPLDNVDLKITDLSFADSFLDFDSIKEFFEDNQQNPDRITLENIEFRVFEKSLKMDGEEKTNFGDGMLDGYDPILDGSGSAVKVNALEGEKEKDLSCYTEEVMSKVSLFGEKSKVMRESGKVGLAVGRDSDAVDGSGAKTERASDENESEGDSESEAESSTSSSSSSSSSSSDDDEEEEEDEDEDEKEEMKIPVKRDTVVVGDLEEGEIEVVDGEEMVARNYDDSDEEQTEKDVVGGSDIEFDDVDVDEIGEGTMGGPIKSKNELQVLPPVPQVNITLQPHHQMQPVGVVLSVIGVQVIVEGVEKHNPLNEGSILWITESRSPLGLIDEIFGPVKNPYYVIRYNSESEIPASVCVGCPISFVQEFANHVLNHMNLYKKGYDASGDNDEELSDEAEFSDDEKEAEYKSKLKMEKRGMSDKKPGNGKNNRKNGKNAWKNDRHSVPQMAGVGQPIPNQNQNQIPFPASLGHGIPSSNILQGFLGGIGSLPHFRPMAPSNGVWTNEMQSQQPQNALFPSGFPMNSMPWPSQNYQQPPFQPMMNNTALLRQYNPIHTLPVGQPNVFVRHTGFMRENVMSQMVGVGLRGQPAPPCANGRGVEIPSNGPQQYNSQAGYCPPAGIETPKQFETSAGASLNHLRKPYHRGGGRFAGGRGCQQSR
ncbi:uncharacterized protein LOC123196279 [Mangifera indica]|uniref:uncharacterized protein LOC123196279 n=1 Tax=Mangifera indica TaxID=29780 RepID=UPI001CF97773|nr:uncharacterized protein LOC123196279 [Mangifera indica]